MKNHTSHPKKSVTKVKILRHPAKMSLKQIEDGINDFIKDVTPISITQHTTGNNGELDLVFTTILYKG